MARNQRPQPGLVVGVPASGRPAVTGWRQPVAVSRGVKGSARTWPVGTPGKISASGVRYRLSGNLSRRRSEEHTSELQSLMRISYAVFCLKKKKTQNTSKTIKVRIAIQHNEQTIKLTIQQMILQHNT